MATKKKAKKNYEPKLKIHGSFLDVIKAAVNPKGKQTKDKK